MWKAARLIVVTFVGACAMPAPQLAAGRGAMMGFGGVVAPARVTVSTARAQQRVSGNGGSYGEVHPFTYILQQQYAIDLPFGEPCRLGLQLSWVGRNGATGRCDVTPWSTVEGHAAWQVFAGPVAHVGMAGERRLGPITLLGGIRVSAGRYLHVIDLPKEYAENPGFEPGMGGAHARFERTETRIELPLAVFLAPDGPSLTVMLVPYRVIAADVITSRCDGCLRGVRVSDYDERWGVGILVGLTARPERDRRRRRL